MGLTIIEQRIEIERKLEKLRKSFDKKDKDLRNLLRQVQKRCPHPDNKAIFVPDASGNNDSFYYCSDCDAVI